MLSGTVIDAYLGAKAARYDSAVINCSNDCAIAPQAKGTAASSCAPALTGSLGAGTPAGRARELACGSDKRARTSPSSAPSPRRSQNRRRPCPLPALRVLADSRNKARSDGRSVSISVLWGTAVDAA